MPAHQRVMTASTPFERYNPERPYDGSLGWPCRWIACPGAGDPPFVSAYRLLFRLDQPETIRVFVSADERYELYVDGERVGRGPERGDPRNWFFETYALGLEAGEHILAARSWALGEYAPTAQFSVRPGFLLCAEDERFWDLLNTGRAAWQARPLEGFDFLPPMGAIYAGHRVALDAARYAWGFERDSGLEGWLPARPVHPGYSAAHRGHANPNEHLLRPALLPAMLDEPLFLGRVRHVSAPALSQTHAIPLRPEDHLAGEAAAWQDLLAGRAVLEIPPHTRRRVIVDLENYYCAYPEALVSGGKGGLLRIHFQEALFEQPGPWDRGNRDEVEGKYFTGIWWHEDGLGDSIRLDGGQGRLFEPLWWNAGRYVEILVEADNQPLTIERLRWRETRYPYEDHSRFAAGDPRLERVIPLAVRALQMCSHETYMDCPYYEQLMYIGDTRLECLVTYLTSSDSSLPRKAMEMFALSRLPDGLTQSRYPSRERQIIPPFSLWWVGMAHDYLMYRGEPEFLRRLLPTVRGVLDAFTARLGEDGLVRSPAGWNYIDWVPAWVSGVPPGGEAGGVCGPLNWQYVYALAHAAELEDYFGEPELAARARRLARAAASALTTAFWSPERGLFADDFDHTIYTEHSQCLALLADARYLGSLGDEQRALLADARGPGLLSDEQRALLSERLFTTPGLTRPTVYFLHYYFETCRLLDRMDVFLDRLQPWFEMPDYGFKTTYENADPHSNRSDCHAWGAHPLYHYFASVLGIRPAAPGFTRVEMRPQLGPLAWAAGTLVHPSGLISAEVRRDGGRLSVQVTLPEGVNGGLIAAGQELPLKPGRNEFSL